MRYRNRRILYFMASFLLCTDFTNCLHSQLCRVYRNKQFTWL